jgi:hypothetical protein
MSEFPLTHNLLVSFQRYPYPPSGSIAETPRSWGALPGLVTAAGRLIIPSAAGEAFWVGLAAPPDAPPASVRVAALLRDGRRIDLDEIRIPRKFAADGIPRDDGSRWPFAREPVVADAPALSALEISAVPDPDEPAAHRSMRVELVPPDRFAERSGVTLGPLDPTKIYGGWLLP